MSPAPAADQWRLAPEIPSGDGLLALNDAVAGVTAGQRAFVPERDAGKPIVYIVGAPRSGTTLAHQLLAKMLPLDYVDNIVARLWRNPVLGLQMSRAVLGLERHRAIVLRSQLGVGEGAAGPHEFGYFWNSIFRYDECRSHHLDDEELAKADLDRLRAVVRGLLANTEHGFLFKNLTCGFQARTLAQAHAKSLFVHIVRDTYATAASILHWRRERHGSYDAWFSLKPRAYPLDEYRSRPAAQVVAQLQSIHAELVAELSAPGVWSMEYRYEDICRDPNAFVGSVADKMRAMGFALDLRHMDRISHSIAPMIASEPVELPNALRNELALLCAAAR